MRLAGGGRRSCQPYDFLVASVMDSHPADNAVQLHACGALSNLACRHAGMKHFCHARHLCACMLQCLAPPDYPSMRMYYMEHMTNSGRHCIERLAIDFGKQSRMKKVTCGYLCRFAGFDSQMWWHTKNRSCDGKAFVGWRNSRAGLSVIHRITISPPAVLKSRTLVLTFSLS